MPARSTGGALTERDWRMIAATLPPSIDQPVLRSALERAIAEPCTPKEMRERSLNQIRDYEGFRRVLSSLDDPNLDPALKGRLSKLAARGIFEMRRQADEYGKLARERHPRTAVKQFAILRAWQHAGGSLGISTPRHRKGTPTKPPTGPVIEYFMSAAAILHGVRPTARTVKGIVDRYKRRHFRRPGAIRFEARCDLTIDDQQISVSPPRVKWT